MSYNLTQILVPGNCYLASYMIGIPVTDYGYDCPPHFYCPNSTAAVIQSLPVICPATAKCFADRIGATMCAPNGPYEPQLCPKGSYCPTTKTIFDCPAGYYCPVGTITPNSCPALSICPSKTISPQYYGGLVFCLIADLVLIIAYNVLKYAYSENKQFTLFGRIARIFACGGDGRQRQKTLKTKLVAPEQVEHGGKDLEETGTPETQMHLGVSTTSGRDRTRGHSMQPVAKLGVTAVPQSPVWQMAGGMSRESVAGELAGFVSRFRDALDGKEVYIDFRFEDLGLKLNTGVTVLKGVNGSILSGKLTAIMGPSGCGKTTFMSVLMGKVARTSGKLYINHQEGEMQRYKKIIGYVPQEDIMLRELTVRENIYHSARVRLPSSWPNSKVNTYVDDVLEVLNLTHVQHNLIGSETERGISGGQRKRVNIGMELAGVPIALFLDEPTSGLDSTAALKVAEILRKIASLGLTIVSVIHQPRYEIFQQFDQLLMLVPGGKTAYIGPTRLVVEYFKSLGFVFDALANPADILMDILSRKGVHSQGNGLTPDELTDEWISRGRSWVEGRITDPEVQDEAPQDQAVKSQESHLHLHEIVKKRGSYFLVQVMLCHNRYLVQQYRRVASLALEVGVAVLAGGLMGVALMGQNGVIYIGVVVHPFELLTPATLEWLLPQMGLLIGMACGLAGAPAGVKVFAEEQAVYWREAANGHDKLAYFIGKAISSIYRFLLSSLHFTSLLTFLATPLAPFPFLFANFFLIFWSVYGLAMVISMIVRREDSALLAVVICLFAAVFNGYGPTIKNGRSWGIEFIYDISYNRWATEAWFTQETAVMDGVFNITQSTDNYGYGLDNTRMNLVYAFLIGCGLRVIAFVLMVGLNRDKQK